MICGFYSHCENDCPLIHYMPSTMTMMRHERSIVSKKRLYILNLYLYKNKNIC